MRWVKTIMIMYEDEEICIDVEKYTDPDKWTPDIVTIIGEGKKGYKDYHPSDARAIWELAEEEANYEDPYYGL